LNLKKNNALSIFGIVFNIDAGVYAVKKKSLVDFTAFSHLKKSLMSMVFVISIYLRKATPNSKLPSYVLGFVLILIVAVVMAATIYSVNPFLLSDQVIDIAPRGIFVLSTYNMALLKNFFISRMVYKKISKKGLLKLLSSNALGSSLNVQ
jgi:hypothetical protein